jgi:hypothetical protein
MALHRPGLVVSLYPLVRRANEQPICLRVRYCRGRRLPFATRPSADEVGSSRSRHRSAIKRCRSGRIQDALPTHANSRYVTTARTGRANRKPCQHFGVEAAAVAFATRAVLRPISRSHVNNSTRPGHESAAPSVTPRVAGGGL